ncbi:MAG: hypothetical protein ACQES0_01650 [Bacteroidota bacterium]
MECPNCHHSGNLLKRPFVKRRGLPDMYCVNCGARVRVQYKWKNIAKLAFFVLVGLFVLHVIMIYAGLPGLNGGIAGGIAGALMVIFMRRPAYVDVEQIGGKKSKKSKKK